MRPLPSDPAFKGRSRNSSFTDATPLPTSRQPQMSYFIADEKTMEASLAQSSTSVGRPRDNPKRSNYAVESLETTINQDSDDQDTSLGPTRQAWKKSLRRNMTRRSDEDMAASRSLSPKSSTNPNRDLSPTDTRRKAPVDRSQAMTPSFLESPLLGSTPGSPMSRRDSEIDFLTDDGASQAILSSGEEDERDSGMTSQLVMPSITMPIRRPFTDKGKNLGRLKVLVAGDSGKLLCLANSSMVLI